MDVNFIVLAFLQPNRQKINSEEIEVLHKEKKIRKAKPKYLCCVKIIYLKTLIVTKLPTPYLCFIKFLPLQRYEKIYL